MYGVPGGGGPGGGGVAAVAGGAGAGTGLAFTGFPIVAAVLAGLILVLCGLMLTRVAMVRRADPAMGPLPFVREPPSSPDGP